MDKFIVTKEVEPTPSIAPQAQRASEDESSPREAARKRADKRSDDANGKGSARAPAAKRTKTTNKRISKLRLPESKQKEALSGLFQSSLAYHAGGSLSLDDRKPAATYPRRKSGDQSQVSEQKGIDENSRPLEKVDPVGKKKGGEGSRPAVGRTGREVTNRIVASRPLAAAATAADGEEGREIGKNTSRTMRSEGGHTTTSTSNIKMAVTDNKVRNPAAVAAVAAAAAAAAAASAHTQQQQRRQKGEPSRPESKAPTLQSSTLKNSRERGPQEPLPKLRTELMTEFFPRVSRAPLQGAPLGATTFTGRNPNNPLRDDSEKDRKSENDGGSDYDSDLSCGFTDVKRWIGRGLEGGGHENNVPAVGTTSENNSSNRKPRVLVDGGTNNHRMSGGSASSADPIHALLTATLPGDELAAADMLSGSTGGGLTNAVGDLPLPAGTATAAAVAKVARTTTAGKAAAAAERRAAAAIAAVGTGAGAGPGTVINGHVAGIAQAPPSEINQTAEESLRTPITAEMTAAQATVSSVGEEALAVSTVVGPAIEVTDAEELLSEEDEARTTAAASEAPSWPCRRRFGMAALALTQRRATGGRIAVGDAGKETFRRRIFSTIFGQGLSTMPLRMGRVSGSRTGAGVVRGHPEGQGGPQRDAGGVSCLEFDSMGALLAAGGVKDVTIYDFDEYVPQIPRVKSKLESGVRAYLQPTHCIHTRRAVSCVRWNPANEDELAVSFLHYDDIEIFDLQTILPNAEATPVLTLNSASGSLPTNSSIGRSGSRTLFGQAGRLGSFRSGPGGGSSSSNGSTRSRGLGYLSFEFVSRGPPGGNPVMHLVAGGRGGVFRAWRLAPKSAKQLAPYLQVQLGSPRSNPSLGAWQPPRSDITAVCCISPDVTLVGTDSGTLIAYSLHPPKVKAFQSGKTADKLAQWFLGDRKVWGGSTPESTGARASAENYRVRSILPSPNHGHGVVVCGLRSGRAIVFDTRSGRALGITKACTSLTSVGFCQAGPHGRGGRRGGWGQAILGCSKSSSIADADADEKELVLMATSARAALDTRRRDGGGRDSGLRPGPGWALGEAGGGGFQVEASRGYDMCLPIEVERATPGQNGVLLSRDARAYLCSRAQLRLLSTRMVTSSIMIGEEEYSVEAVNSDGMELVLNRKYWGVPVGARREGLGEGASIRTSRSRSIVSVGSNAHSPDSALDSNQETVKKSGSPEVSGTEVDDNEGQAGPQTARVSTAGGSTISSSGAAAVDHDTTSNVEPNNNTGLTEGNGGVLNSERDASRINGSGGNAESRGDEHRRHQDGETDEGGYAEDAPAATTEEDSRHASESQQRRQGWDHAWRPASVRIFAKLKAVFGGGGGNCPEQQQSPHVGFTYPWQSASKAFDVHEIGEGGASTEGEGGGDGGSQRTPSWASLEVVSRARLGLPATAVTCHPRMNFILVGLSDGTIVPVLPGSRKKAKTGTHWPTLPP